MEGVKEAGELEGLGRAAAALDAELGADEYGPAPVIEEDGPGAVEEMAAMLGAVVALAAPLLPYLPGIYTKERVQQLAAAYVQVAEKYGWDAGGWLDRYGAEFALVAVAGPLIVQTRQAHIEWRADKGRQVAEERRQALGAVTGAEAAEQVPRGPGTVQFGAVEHDD